MKTNNRAGGLLSDQTKSDGYTVFDSMVGPDRMAISKLATTPCRGLSLSR
jgi:hypothetical protein